jgi:hypothetical protein
MNPWEEFVLGRKPAAGLNSNLKPNLSNYPLLKVNSMPSDLFHPRKRTSSPTLSLLSRPLKFPLSDREGPSPKEHEEVDSTSECDSEYSSPGPPTKKPWTAHLLHPDAEENVEDTKTFGSFKSLTSEIEIKYKSVLSENQKLRQKVPTLEIEICSLKNSNRELETCVQAEKTNCRRAKRDRKLVENSLQEAKGTIESLDKQLQV